MKTNALKLSLRKDTIRVLSSSEMSLVVGGLALSPVQARGTNTYACSIHCATGVCPVKAVTTAVVIR